VKKRGDRSHTRGVRGREPPRATGLVLLADGSSRSTSLEGVWCTAVRATELETLMFLSGRGWPLVTVVNGPLMARRPLRPELGRISEANASPAILSVSLDTFRSMNVDVWLPPVLAAVIGALLSPSVGKGLLVLAGARARRIKHVRVDGAELYANGVPMDEAQFRAAFAAYQAELAELSPPAQRTEWEMKRQFAAAQRLAVITGRHPHAFPNIGDPDQAWEWYRDNNPYVTGDLPRRHEWRLLPPGDIATN
jgi:hypothetical protein